MFADFLHSESVRSHTVKDLQLLRYKAKPDLLINLTKDRLDPGLGRTPAVHSTGPAYRRATNLMDSVVSSTKIWT
jgi:hypothetical protein